MADDLNRREPEDKRFISLSEDWEVRYWTKALGVTKEELQKAVASVGTGTAKVKEYLGK